MGTQMGHYQRATLRRPYRQKRHRLKPWLSSTSTNPTLWASPVAADVVAFDDAIDVRLALLERELEDLTHRAVAWPARVTQA